MKELRAAKKILVFAREAGGASYISSLLKKYKVASSKIVCLAEGAASKVFRENKLKVQKTFENYRKIDLILLGATPGDSLEKKLIKFGQQNKIPVFSFVDHYWNMWQRFADPKTLKRWEYVPDRIYVIDRFAKNKLVGEGFSKNKVSILSHPKPTPGKLTTSDVKARLGVPPEFSILLFVSENLFRNSQSWKWEQASEKDYRLFAKKLIRSVVKDRLPFVVIIKSHPSEQRDWNLILKGLPTEYFRVVKDFDRLSLIESAHSIYGLNSMMLLEAVKKRKKVFSWHAVKKNRANWLSAINPNVQELKRLVLPERYR